MTTPRDMVLAPDAQTLKAASAALTRAYGGQEAAALAVGRAQSRLSDWGNVNTADFMPVDVVAQLEAATQGLPGAPHVTALLAQRTGHVLVRLPDAPPVGTDLLAFMAAHAKESGEIQGSICAALADGRVDATEARRVRKEIRDQLVLLVGIDAVMAAIEAGDA